MGSSREHLTASLVIPLVARARELIRLYVLAVDLWQVYQVLRLLTVCAIAGHIAHLQVAANSALRSVKPAQMALLMIALVVSKLLS
jgi:hypothetical protein